MSLLWGSLVLLVVMPICCFGPGFFVARRLRWTKDETIATSIGLSILLLYLVSTFIYLTGIDWHAGYAYTAICLMLLGAAAKDFWNLLRSSHGQRLLMGCALLLLIAMLSLGVIRDFSGGTWSGDWLEHYQRSQFFLDRTKPLDTRFISVYDLPARPPLMNIIATYFLAHTADKFELFEIAFSFLNLLVFFPCVLLAGHLIRFGNRRVWAIAGVLSLSPFILQNATWSWTKLLSAFFVLLAIALYLRSLVKQDPTRMLMAAAMMAGAILVHYSAAPCGIAVGLHYLLRVRSRSHPAREIFGSLGVGGLLLATWFAWSIARYGMGTTFGSNTTVTDSSRLSAFENGLKIAKNICSTLMPHPFRLSPNQLRFDFDQPNPFGFVRDYFFTMYQSSLPVALGLVGWVSACVLMRNALRATDSARRQFWLILLTVGLLLAIAVHGSLNEYGLAHVCIQPIVVIGLTLLAAGLPTLPRWGRIVTATGIAVDAGLGLLLQMRMQMHWYALAPPDVPSVEQIVPLAKGMLTPMAIQNSVLCNQLFIDTLGDHLASAGTIIFAGLIAATCVSIWIVARSASLPSLWQIIATAIVFSMGVMCMCDRALGYEYQGRVSYSGRAVLPVNELDARIASKLQAVSENPESPQAHYELGLAYYELRDIDHAAAELTKAFLLDPQYYDARYVLRVLLISHGLFLESTEAWAAEWYRLDSADRNAVLLLARTLQQHGFLSAAKMRTDEAARLTH